MKVNGKKVPSAWEPDPLVLDRGRDENGEPEFLVFRARGIKSFDEFNEMCPKPKCQDGMLTPDGWVPDEKSDRYKDEMSRYRQLRWAYIVIKTLEPSNIEWDKVSLKHPKTWLHYEEELNAVLLPPERGLLVDLINQANALDESKLEENRQTFFRIQERLGQNQTGQLSDQENKHSGEPVLEPECVHQD